MGVLLKIFEKFILNYLNVLCHERTKLSSAYRTRTINHRGNKSKTIFWQ